jgi:outer membrane receptor protein involved in Fe transport
MQFAQIYRIFARVLAVAASAALCLTLSTGAAFGQEIDETIEEIKVTGTRITRANQVQPNPVYGLDSEEIKATGQLNMIDVVDDLPQLFSSQNGAQSNFFDSTDTGSGVDNTPGLALLDLRSLGATRTLVLVDGRRHVSGQAGGAGVDIGTIPSSLVDRVEVLTGGASSIYGADAVSGVVNFIMKDNFEGTEIDLQAGVPGDSGGGEWQLSLTHGQNFMDDRLNITVNASYRSRDEILMRDRDWAIDSGIAGGQGNNWRRVFQNMDSIPAGAALGDSITTTDAGGNCVAAFPGTDSALVSRACSALPQSIERNLRFGLTAPQGLISINLADDITAAVPERAADFPLFHQTADLADLAPGTPIMDFDGNGVDDCIESFVGQDGFWIGGCSVIDNATGNLRAFDPGIVDGVINFDAIGSDGSPQNGADHQSLDPEYEQFVFNALINFDVNNSTSLFADLKYVSSDTNLTDGTISYEDTINISQQNPFVPAALSTLMNDILALNPQFANTAQYFMSRDPEDIHNDTKVERETIRIVAGIEGDFWDTWTWEAAVNYGRTEEDVNDQALLLDRYYASIDSVDDGSGNPVCRSEVDPNWTLDTYNTGSIFGVHGVNTFTPGDGSCAPGNPFGTGNWSLAAQDFIAPVRTQNDEVTQTVLSLIVTGDTERWFSLPGGPLGLAGGIEYREEESDAVPDLFEQNGYYHESQTSPVSGDFSVTDFFIEFSAPLLEGVTLAQELTIDGSYRLSDYDLAVGQTNSYSGGISWAPIEDVRFRGTFSRAVRAPGIFELFSPRTQTGFNLDIDVCDQSSIDSLALSDPATAANRTANCAADPLVGPNFTNPLTSQFAGITGGNPDLNEETSDTLTIGAVFTPRFVEGLTFTVDYWDIEIEDAIQQIGGEDILRGCYDKAALDPTFCSQFTRISDPASGFFGGLSFMETGRINFAALTTSGYDAEVVYDFDLFDGSMTLRANATFLDELLEFRSAFDPTSSDDEKGEILRPEWAGNFSATWGNSNLTLGYQARYMGNQLHRTVEVNEAASFNNANTGSLWIHNVSGNYAISDRYTVYGGIQNFTDEQPFDTQPAFPTGLRGAYFFAGVTVNL